MNAIYARVSTEEQAKTGYSLSDQVNSCRKLLLSKGLSDCKEYIDDGYSGEYLERPWLEQLRNDLRSGLIKNVVVYDPDRLARNLTNMLLIADEINSAGAKLNFITGDYDASPEGKLFFSIRGAIAEFEKAKIRERTMRGKRSKALAGKLVFNDDLYGYTFDKEKSNYIINEKEAEIVRMVFELYTTKNYGINSLSLELKALGIVNRKGNPFGASTLCYMLQNETYAGTKWAFTTYDRLIGQKKRKVSIRNESEWIPITVPAIITPELFKKAEECRIRKKATAKRNTKIQYLLSNIIRCLDCGYAMHGVRFPKNGKKKDYTYYVCTAYNNQKECPNNKCIPSKELDENVWNELLKQAKEESGIFSYKNKKQIPDKTKANLEKQLEKLQKSKAALVKLVSAGKIEYEQADKELDPLNKEIGIITAALSKIPEINKEPKKFSSKEVLALRTFEEKRDWLLRSGMKIFAKKENGETSYEITP